MKPMFKVGFAILSTLFINQAQLLVATAETINVPAGTRVPIIVPNNISSNSVKASDTLTVSIAQDVLVGSKVVFHQGDSASLNVQKAQSSGHFGRPGVLELDSGFVTDSHGDKHPVNISYIAKGASRRAFSITGTVLSVPLLLFLVGFVTLPVAVMTSGKEAKIGQGLVLDTLTTAPSEVEL